jgi:hypothetical protein
LGGFFLLIYIEMHGQRDIKKNMLSSLAGVRAVLGRPAFTTAANATLHVSRDRLCNHHKTWSEVR